MHCVTMARLPQLLWVALLCAQTACATYDVRQSSLVPAATPPPPPSFERRADLYVADTTVLFLDEPERAPNETAGLWIPRHQLDGALSVRFGRYMGMRLTYRQGLSAGAMRAAPTTLPNPGNDVRAVGLGMSFRVPFHGEPLELLLSWDNSLVLVPSYVEATCISWCDGSARTVTRHDVDSVPMLSAGASLQYVADDHHRAWLTLVGQTHPTNQERFESTETDAQVEMGRANLIAALGAEIHVTEGFSFVPQIQWPVTAMPVRYGPILGLGLRGSFGSEVPRP